MEARELREIANANNEWYNKSREEFRKILELLKEAANKGEYSILYEIPTDDSYEWSKNHKITDSELTSLGYRIDYKGRHKGIAEYLISF